MTGWTLDVNGTSITPAVQVEEISMEDPYWLENNLMPIISPIKGVGVEFVKNVIYGVPKPCPIIFVSATEDPNLRAQERSIIKQFNGPDGQERDILWIPQDGDEVKSFLESNYEALIEDGEVMGGHREALLIGSFAAKSLGAEYIGMVDGDNWTPMSIREFVTLYARGFREGGEYVSLEWRCKPKCGEDGFAWRRSGRTSLKANSAINRLVDELVDVITSSCSGDHAVTVDLWDRIEHTENHSGEVNAFVKMMEGDPSAEVKQYRTMSPMFHQYGVEEHIDQEINEVMRAIYNSRLADDKLRREVQSMTPGDAAVTNRSYPPTEQVGTDFLESIKN